MADVKDTMHFIRYFYFVVKIRILPIQRVALRRFQISFACSHVDTSINFVGARINQPLTHRFLMG